MSWDTCKFSSLYATPSRNGLTRPSGSRGKGYKMVNMGELFSNGRIGNIPMELVELEDSKKEAYGVKEGDLLFARQSLVLEGAGKCSWIKEVSEYTTFESHLIRVRLNPDVAVSLFYYYYFNSPQSPIKSIVQQCAQAGIRASDLEDLNVLCPPLPIQRRIADILSAYDDLIENNQRQIKLLEEAAMRLYREWFVFMRFPGHESVRIVDGVPEGWKYQELKEIADIVMGQSPDSSYYNSDGDGLPFHQGVSNYGERYVSNVEYCSVEKRSAVPNSILFSVRAPVGRINLTREKVVIGRGLAAINHKLGKQSYLFYLLKSHFSVEDMIGNGSVFSAVTKSDLEDQKLLTPSFDLVEVFSRIVEPMDAKINSLDMQIERLQKARDALLPRLMNGGEGLKLEGGAV